MASQIGSDKIDRQTTTPFHLKLFYRSGAHHRLDDFPVPPSTALLPAHLQIYTWQSCTLRELSHLLVSALPTLLPSPAIGTRLVYRLIFPDTREAARHGPGRYMAKELGSVVIGSDDGPGVLPTADEAAVVNGGPMAGRLDGEPDRCLRDVRFVIGDYVACSIFAPGKHGAVVPPGVGYGRGRLEYGASRENGYAGGYRSRGGGGGTRAGGVGFGRLVSDGGLPDGEWRRGERLPDGGRGSYRGRGRGW